MITKRAKKIGVIALIYCLGGLVVLIGTVYLTQQNKQKFADVRAKNAEAEAAKQLSTTIEQTLQVSARDRATLDTFFISERDTIDFITEVETLAQTLQVQVETTQLSVIPATDTEPSRLQIGFVVKGSYNNVARMLFALETLPYHRTIPDRSISKTLTGEWEGSMVLHVTLK